MATDYILSGIIEYSGMEFITPVTGITGMYVVHGTHNYTGMENILSSTELQSRRGNDL